MTQSPGMPMTSQKKGFRTIYDSGTLKFEISSSESVIKKTSRSGKKVELYDRVNDRKRIQEIRNKSENCIVRLGDEYIIQEQQNAQDRPNGFCNVIKRSKAKVRLHWMSDPDVWAKYSESDWMYYERRRRPNEI